LFERTGSDPAWRHFENNSVYGRPGRELVLPSAAAIGNYDYLMDWRFRQDGTIEVALGATGVIETKSTVQKNVAGHATSRIRRNPGIFARLRSFAYNILRFNQSDTIAQDRYAAALGGPEALCDMNYYKER
jgi:Cu2+-containing amine oxidase